LENSLTSARPEPKVTIRRWVREYKLETTGINMVERAKNIQDQANNIKAKGRQSAEKEKLKLLSRK
jgi:hypothetical protein